LNEIDPIIDLIDLVRPIIVRDWQI